jgi:predicted amidophosphoribosyltransferase
MARYMVDAVLHAQWPELFARSVTLVPVPSSRRSVRRRGFSTGALLAREMSHAMALPLQGALRLSDSIPQKSLSLAARTEHARSALRLIQPMVRIPRRVVLVDDVVTTGATVSQAALLLKDAGVEDVAAIAFAMEY